MLLFEQFRVRQLIAHFSVISQSRVEIYKRLQNLLNAYAILKENLAQKRDSLKRMESRMDIVSYFRRNKFLPKKSNFDHLFRLRSELCQLLHL